jgi:hypothetical protein
MKTSHPIAKSGHNIVLVIAVLLFMAVLIYGAFFADNVKEASAGSAHNVSGYAWSDNIGWISFNCTDEDTCATSDYGVNIASDGDMSGYAWSDNVGWITFYKEGSMPGSDLSGCPSGTCEAKLSGNNLQGWARALSYGDDWDGWISLSGTAEDGSPYGVVLNGDNLEGYAWDASKNDPSDDDEQAIGSGWIQFNPTYGGVIIGPGNAPTVSLSVDTTLPIQSGENAELSWTSTNTTNCVGTLGAGNWADNNPKALSGSEVVGPHTIDTVYWLTCTNSTSQASDSATVFVTPLPSFECSDGIDNDGDGVQDAGDPGCYDNGVYDSEDDNESDTLPECNNNFDDDGDGFTDYPADSGCSDEDDNVEQNIGFEEF